MTLPRHFCETLREYLGKCLATPLQSINLRTLTGTDRDYVLTAVKQLGARTARSYRAIASEIREGGLDRETDARLSPLEHMCRREFECCLELSEVASVYQRNLECGEISKANTLRSNEIGDEARVESIMKGGEHGTGDSGGASASTERFIDVLEKLRPHDNLFDIVVNELWIRSPRLNSWLSCFCRRRVSWRIIHEHILHLLEPNRYSSIIRQDHDVSSILKHTGRVVVEQYERSIQSTHGGSIAIHVEEQPELFTRLPSGRLATSSDLDYFVCPSASVAPAPPSDVIYSVERHLEYVFRELMKNACAATHSRTKEIELHVGFASDDTHVVVDVRDAAGGISADDVEKLWFFGWTTNSSFDRYMGGFGVGLPVSKCYMDLWGGRMDLYTTEGIGTTVRVVFPKAPTEVFRPKKPPPTSA
ncbi:transferase [Trypanosoma rangeli]|uniref:Protein-serine/threonine kinase n=1 Tax=Trypanosoma rangeli TaxID=5698 RepID=A0A3S5IRS7_TRYRA|nr:transferase [Trypanosoma rangeli]RNF08570.1 transferase [Trypanosoma rangeli]|eukprot:RNF08570.1 transferase [Trypanosoma rangeli]